MKHIKCLTVLLFMMGCYHATAQDLLLKKAPPLQLKAMLQVPANRQWATGLGGKIVVLEFWATWCTPCMASVAHINQLSRQFAGRMVQFIAITQEPESLISGFLQKRTMDGWVGIDSAGTTFKNYGVTSIPHTFIIDTTGIVQFEGEPSMLNEQIITDALAGTYRQEAIKYSPARIFGGWAPGDDPVFTANFDPKKIKVLQQTTIRQSAGNSGTGTKNNKGCVGLNIMSRNLPSVIAFLEDLSSSYRVINGSSVSDTILWDVIFLRSKGYDMPKALKELTASVLESFSITVKDSIVRRNVLVPVFGSAAKVLDEKNIDFRKPETHTFRSLKTIYNKMEAESGLLINYPPAADQQYLDIFDIMPVFHQMTGSEIKQWMVKQGFSFRETSADITLRAISNSVSAP